MSPKVVAFSTRSGMLYAQPFGLHFWECAREDLAAMRRDPRGWMARQGIDLPNDVRIELTLEEPMHHDLGMFETADVICNVGGWRPADGERVFRIISYVPDQDGAEWFRGSVLPRGGAAPVAA